MDLIHGLQTLDESLPAILRSLKVTKLESQSNYERQLLLRQGTLD